MHAFGAVLSLVHAFAVTHAGSYLTLGIDDCFERVSIGKRLNSSDVTKTFPTSSLKQCTNECERMLCNAYSYGVNGNGNGTCLLGLDLPKSAPYDDPEYDLFMKILQCRDRTTCFIKLVGGRRLIDKYIQRTLPSETKGDCELYCEYEKEFRCEGFSFRYDTKSTAYSSCQLTAAQSEKFDLSSDFQSDVEYDFYERNANASPSCRYSELTGGPYGQRRDWAGQDGRYVSLWQDVGAQWYHKNDLGYGNHKVFYDRGVQSTPAFLEYDGVTPLSIKPNNPFSGGQFPYGGISPIWVSSNECFIKARTGHRLQSENVIKSMNAPTLYGCETICANEQTFTCNIFSYRYSSTSSTDNCHLGDKMLRQLDIFQDLVSDRDSDVFARNELSQPGCQPTRNWDTDCFERIRSGLTFQVSIIKFSVQAENLHECELICLHVKHFTCRVFSFRQGPSVIGKWSENCHLTDYPVTDMDPTKHLVEDSGCDIYNRGSYGRGCELDKAQPPSGWYPVPGQDLTPTVLTTYRPEYGVPPPLSPVPSLYGPKYGPPISPPLQFFPSFSPSPPPQYFPVGPSSTPSPTTPPQYFPTGPPSTLSPPSNYYPVTPTVFDTSTRRSGTYVPSLPPTTFFQIPGEYTPVSIRPLDRESTPGGVFKDLFDPYGQNPTRVPTLYGPGKKLCYISFGRSARLLPSAVKKTMTVESEYQCQMECNKAREGQSFRCSTLSYFGGYCELSDIEMRDLKPNRDFSLDHYFFLYAWDFNEIHCYSSPTPTVPPTSIFPGGLEWTWMRFTVNGQPCKAGSYCTQNLNTDVWSCPVDQGDWDYCCKPDHKCGYSEGISYPWCQVGKTADQWRPCSDQYFPSTDGAPHTWPVTYIHHAGPPVAGSPLPVVPSQHPATPSPLPAVPATLPAADDGAGNGTLQTAVTKHEQSLVDQFLSIFSSAASSPSPTLAVPDPSVREAAVKSTASLTGRNRVVDLPGFRVVDVTYKPPRAVHGLYGAVDSDNDYYRYRNGFAKRRPYYH